MGTTRPVPGGVRALERALYHRRLLLLKSLWRRVTDPSSELSAAARATFARHWLVLERAEAHAPEAVRATLAYPTVGTRLVRALGAADGGEFATELGQFGAIAAAAALRSGCPAELTLPAPGGSLTLPGVGTVPCPGGEFTLRPGARRGARRLRRLPGGTARLDDLDPYRVPQGAPGLRATVAEERQPSGAGPWDHRWTTAMALLRAVDQRRAEEVAALTRCVIPLAPPSTPARPAEPPGRAEAPTPPARPPVHPAQHGARTGSRSATLRAAPGAVLSVLPASGEVLAEVLVHEIQHSKLAVLCDLLPLYRPGGAAHYRVPWRSDPRPVGAVLQGAYAHLAMADLWHRVGHARGARGTGAAEVAVRRERCRAYVGEALRTLLESDELTEAGREFTGGMRREYRRLGRPRTRELPHHHRT
ncbi:hypothetical protein E0L36_11770 [Streptomyces sp. AJS327]|uniref:aKG-HExxH-type peptide beta-hydroxylase n=1 Tax=Streptomyces sp. AJS327 TaxID=2545265 RepID=UPI0015DD77AE|nr:HEXXH motif-containing putative peptide modification protein [Streptomyces sp. AJS327]MBA0051546.1 hypothetical protein [Streptomyces sp. AJS327]